MDHKRELVTDTSGDGAFPTHKSVVNCMVFFCFTSHCFSLGQSVRRAQWPRPGHLSVSVIMTRFGWEGEATQDAVWWCERMLHSCLMHASHWWALILWENTDQQQIICTNLMAAPLMLLMRLMTFLTVLYHVWIDPIDYWAAPSQIVSNCAVAGTDTAGMLYDIGDHSDKCRVTNISREKLASFQKFIIGKFMQIGCWFCHHDHW